MARPSRTRRGKQRSDDYQAPAAPARKRERQDRSQQVRPTERTKSQTGSQKERRGGFRGFSAESYAELRKVEWPTRRQLISATVVVIVAIAVVGTFLAIADYAFSHLVRDLLLGF